MLGWDDLSAVSKGWVMSNEVKLTVPADRCFLPAILDFVSGYSRAMGMEGHSLDEIRLALEEVVGNVIARGFEGGGRESLHIEMHAVGAGLNFLIRERGLSLGADGQGQGSAPGNAPGKDLGLCLLRRTMDEVSFSSQGGEGKETRLVKRLCPDWDLEPALAEPAGDPPVSGELSFEVRRMRAHEAPEVAKLAYFAHRSSYSDMQVCDSSTIRLRNDQDAMASFVAATDDGRIMGHAALVFHDEMPRVPELGVAFVKPRFRRQGCMTRLLAWLVEEARQRKVYGLFAQGMCSHPYANQVLFRLGLKPCLLRLACAPLADPGEHGAAAGRESFITSHRYMSAGPGKPLFFPQAHAQMLGKIYGWQGRQVSVSIAPEGLDLPDRPLSMDFSMVSATSACMRIKRYGQGVAAEVKFWLRRARAEQMEVVFLSLDLSDPLTAGFVPQFEAMGFFFAGVMPGAGGKDFLLLQHLNNVEVDFEALKAGSEQGRELIAYVRGCAARADA